MIAPVLYVDDDRANLVVFEAALEGVVPLRTASSGAEALDLMRREEISVLLTDQRMPGMTGVELAEHVKVEFPDTIRMLITAYSDLNAAVEAINRGQVHLYLRKPWEPRELRQALLTARERYVTSRRLKELEARLVATERVYALGVVAAGIAHELRNPLSVLRTNVEVARAEVQTLGRLVGDAPPVAESLRHIEEGLDDCILAADAVTEITRSIELSTRSTPEGEVDLREVVQLAARSIRADLYRRGQLELELAEVPPVRGARTRLGQVVLNLLVNALEAMPAESKARNRLRVLLSSEGERVRLHIEDNGTGIPPQVAERIFDPFFTTKTEGGTGLGLAISRRIVEELGGTICVKSQLGLGTRFEVELPAARAG